MKRLTVLPFLLFWASCAGVPKPGLEISDAQKALRRDVLSQLAERGASLRGLRGLATVRYGSKLFGVKGETAFALRRPGELRVDALSDFGAFASQVILAKGRLQIIWPADGKYFLGAADREAMERFLMIGLDPKEVVDVFLGIVPLETEDRYRLVKSGDRNVTLRGDHGELTVRRADGRFVPTRYVERDGNGRTLYEVRYDGFRENAGQLFAELLQAEFREPKSRIEIRFKEIELNPKLDRHVFQQKIPENARPLK